MQARIAMLTAVRTGTRRRWNLLVACCVVYLAVVITACYLLHAQGDRWWLITAALLFGPRWLLALPAVALLPACALKRRRALWLVVPAVILTVFGVLDFNVPWRRLAPLPASTAGTAKLRIITCNVHHHALNAAAFTSLLASTSPDVVLLQEWTSHDESAFAGTVGWSFRRNGEFFLATRLSIATDELVRFPGIQPEEIAASYRLELSGRPIRIYNVHLKSPHHAFEALLHRAESARDQIDTNSRERDLQSWGLSAAASHSTEPTFLAGDFNTPSESALYDKHWSKFTDAFTAGGFGFGNTYCTRLANMRIDHILSSPRWTCRTCQVGPDVGSPHRPLIADLEMH